MEKRDPIFVGLTRPTMMWGVTVEGVLVNFMLTAIIFIASNNILLLLIAVPIHAISYLLCLHDPHIFGLLGQWLKTKGACNSRNYWKASTSSPTENTRKRNLRMKK